MKRLVISANAVPRDGGLGLNFAHMLEGLRGEFEVEVFCAGPAEGFPTHIVPPPARMNRFFSLPLIRRFRGLHANLVERHFDVTVARQMPTCDLFQGLTGQCERSLSAAHSRGARSLLDVVTVHNDEGDLRVARECAAFGTTLRPNRSQGARRKREYAAAHRIRVMSHHARRTFLERGFPPERVLAIHPPVEVEQFPVTRFGSDRFRVTFIGRLEIGKAFHHAIEAFRAAQLPDAELVLWGGSGSREVTRYLRERVDGDASIQVRPVPIRTAGLDEVFGKSHVVVHPSVADGFGYVVAESMATGVPVIASDTTGGSDWIEDGKNGFVVPCGDIPKLRDRLIWCHRNRDRLPELGRAARAKAAAHSVLHFRSEYLPVLHALAHAS